MIAPFWTPESPKPLFPSRKIERYSCMPSAAMMQRMPLKPRGGLPVPNPVLLLYSETGTYQTSGGSAATADNDPVGEWQDQSGLAHHPGQATAGLRPLLKLTQVNGYPSVRFDGTDDYLKATWAFSKPMTIFIVVNSISWTNNDHMVGGGSGDVNNIFQGAAGSNVRYYSGETGSGAPQVSPTNGVWCILCAKAEADGTGESKQLRLNAGAASTQTGVASGVNGITLGAHPNPSNYADCEFAAVVMYASFLSTGDETLVRDFLNAKYAIF